MEKIVGLKGGVCLPAKLCEMTFEAFNRTFEALLAGRQPREAFEIANEAHRRIFGHTRYSSYDSFRTVRSRELKLRNNVPSGDS